MKGFSGFLQFANLSTKLMKSRFLSTIETLIVDVICIPMNGGLQCYLCRNTSLSLEEYIPMKGAILSL